MQGAVEGRGTSAVRRWTAAVWLVVAAAGCGEAELKLPPPKTPRAVVAPVAEPDPMPLPDDAPARPEFPPVGSSDAERREAAIRDECFATAEALLASAPADPAGWVLLGVVHERFGDPSGASAAWGKALALDPRQATAQRHLGDAAARVGDLERATHHYREAIGIDPDALAVVDRLAETLVARGDLIGAAELVSSFVVGRPEIAEGWCLLGRIRLLSGKAEGARDAFRRALEVDPSSRDALEGVRESIRAEAGEPVQVVLTRRLEDRRESSRENRRMEEAPDMPLDGWAATVQFWAASAFQRLGDTARAAICWRRAVELDPLDGDSREALALLMENGGRTRDAMRVRQAWCDAEPDNPSAWFGKAKLALALGLPGDAVESLRRVVALAPGRSEGHALLSQALATSDPAASLEAARRAADLDPTAGHLLLLAETLARLGENVSAEAAAERALSIDARDPRARALLDRLRGGAGGPPKAPPPDGPRRRDTT